MERQYHAQVKQDIMYGRFQWCGNPNCAGPKLANKEISSICIPFKYDYLLRLSILMNDNLVEDTEYIHLVSDDKFLFGYNTDNFSELVTRVGLDSNVYVTTKVFNSHVKIGDTLTIEFKRANITEEYLESIRNHTFSRIPTETIHTVTITIDDLKQHNNECPICWEEFKCECGLNKDCECNKVDCNKYIGFCGHACHMTCLYNYLEQNNLLDRVRYGCAIRGCGIPHVKPFNCPMCRKQNYGSFIE